MKFRQHFSQKHSLVKIYLNIFTLAIIALSLRAKVVTAQNFSNAKLNGWVMDTINILSPETESKLNQAINELEEKNGTEIIVLTVSATKGYNNTDDFAARLLAYWSINHEQLKNAILLVYSKGDDRPNRKLRYSIGVSTGPEVKDAFPEEIVSTFMQVEIDPLLEQGKYQEAILQTNQGMINILNQYELKTNNKTNIRKYYSLIIAIYVLLLITILAIALRNSLYSNQNGLNVRSAKNGTFKTNSSKNLASADVDLNNSTPTKVTIETIDVQVNDQENLAVDNLEKSTINISEKVTHNQPKNQDELVNNQSKTHHEEHHNQELNNNKIEHNINFNTLEIIPLDDLEVVVNEFQSKSLKLLEFVQNQEEELTTKCDLVKELKDKLAQCSPIEKLILESRIQELEESTKFLEQTLVGQRNNLKKQQILLDQHLKIFNRRKNISNLKDLENLDYHKLETMPLDKLKNLVKNLKNKYLKLVDFVNMQEEELMTQCYLLKQLEEKISQSDSIKKSVLELEIIDIKELIKLLNKTLSGQRHNLEVKHIILHQHLVILNQRKKKLQGKKSDQTTRNCKMNQSATAIL